MQCGPQAAGRKLFLHEQQDLLNLMALFVYCYVIKYFLK